MHSPLYSKLLLEKEEFAAYVIDRETFDKDLASEVRDMRTRTRAKKVLLKKDHVEVHTNKGIARGKVVIGCDGANSVVRKCLGQVPREIVSGIYAMTKERNYSDRVDMWFDHNHLPDGFFWKIPRGERTEYGMFGKRASFSTLERFFGVKKYHAFAAPIPMGIIKTSAERALIVGDAACQVKPWSGGGIVYGMLCSRLACAAVRKAFDTDDFSKESFIEYDDAWKSLLARPIRMSLLARSLYKRMGNKRLEFIFKLMKRNERIINKLDMDFVSKHPARILSHSV